MKISWVVKLEGWILGAYRRVGDVVQATEEEAKYIVMSGAIEKAQEITSRKKGKRNV